MSNSNSTGSGLPNPFTVLAYLPPDIAFQTQVARYILVGLLGAFVWDILSGIDGDYKLLVKHRVGFPTIIYFVSRVAAFFYVLIATIFETTAIGHCQVYEKVVDVTFPIAVPATCLLFFFRVRAVFLGNKYIVGFFFILWLSVLGGCLTTVTAVRAINIGPTDYCLNASLKPYTSAAVITPLVHDTFVFVAISGRLLLNSHINDGLKTRAKTFMLGKYLPAFSRALLKDGQLYYLTSICMNLLSVMMVYTSAVPVTYKTTLSVPNVMLTSIMACRVFRRTKFGLITEPTTFSTRPGGRVNNVTPIAFFRPTIRTGIDTDHVRDEENNIEVIKAADALHNYPTSVNEGLSKEV